MTSNALPGEMVSGQAVTVQLPSESLRVLAPSNGTAPLELAEQA